MREKIVQTARQLSPSALMLTLFYADNQERLKKCADRIRVLDQTIREAEATRNNFVTNLHLLKGGDPAAPGARDAV